MLIPFICATFIAQRVGEFFNEGLYDIHNGLSGVPILPWTPPVGARLMSVSEFMTSPVVCFTERVRMREVWEALCFTCHNAFPVVRYPPDQGTRPYQKRFGKFCDLPRVAAFLFWLLPPLSLQGCESYFSYELPLSSCSFATMIAMIFTVKFFTTEI